MTNKQRQLLLAFLGLYEGNIDGIWGNLSQSALEAFQRDHGLPVGKFTGETRAALLEAVAAWEPETSFWEACPNFTREELRCTCGGRGCDGFPAEPRERLVRNVQEARTYFGRPVIVSSGVRCRLRNRELSGSAANSLHLSGRAMDFCVRGVGSGELLKLVRTLPGVDECYAIDGSYVHMGVEKYEGGK